MIQQASTSLYHNWYSQITLCYYTLIDTANYLLLCYYITINITSHYVSILSWYITQYANILLLTQQAIRIQQSYVTILQLIQNILILYSSGYNNLLRYHIPIDTASYYVPILLLILQAIMLLYYHWYLIQQPSLLIYTIDSASFPIILWYFDTKPNTATLMIWYSDMFLLIQQYSLLLYSDWYNKLLC